MTASSLFLCVCLLRHCVLGIGLGREYRNQLRAKQRASRLKKTQSERAVVKRKPLRSARKKGGIARTSSFRRDSNASSSSSRKSEGRKSSPESAAAPTPVTSHSEQLPTIHTSPRAPPLSPVVVPASGGGEAAVAGGGGGGPAGGGLLLKQTQIPRLPVAHNLPRVHAASTRTPPGRSQRLAGSKIPRHRLSAGQKPGMPRSLVISKLEVSETVVISEARHPSKAPVPITRFGFRKKISAGYAGE